MQPDPGSAPGWGRVRFEVEMDLGTVLDNDDVARTIHEVLERLMDPQKLRRLKVSWAEVSPLGSDDARTVT